jgi:hypothetical protein
MITKLGLLKMDNEDLFEHYEMLPIEVKEILDKHSNDDPTYENCRELDKDLGKVGYTCDYGLDGIPYDLRNKKSIRVYELNPVRCFRMSEGDDIIDIYTPDITDPSGTVCMMRNGDFVPFSEWDDYEEKLQKYFENNW